MTEVRPQRRLVRLFGFSPSPQCHRPAVMRSEGNIVGFDRSALARRFFLIRCVRVLPAEPFAFSAVFSGETFEAEQLGTTRGSPLEYVRILPLSIIQQENFLRFFFLLFRVVTSGQRFVVLCILAEGRAL